MSMYYYYAYLENGICIDIERTRTIKTDLTNYVEVTVNEYDAYMNEDTTSEYYIIGLRWNGLEWVAATLYYYAIINEKNIVVSLIANVSEIERDNYISITEEEYTSKSCINCQWDAEAFQFVVVPLSIYADADTTKVSVNGTDIPLQTLLDTMQAEIASKGSDVTATDILAALTTVDGAGSGVDSDTLDGRDSSYFARNDDVQAMMIEMDTKANAADLTGVATKSDLETIKTEILSALASGTGSVIKSIQKGYVLMENSALVTLPTAVNPDKAFVLLNGSVRIDEDEYAFAQVPYMYELTATTIEFICGAFSGSGNSAHNVSWQVVEFY